MCASRTGRVLRDARQRKTRPPNMHADVPTWSDVCDCAPEPRWRAMAEEMERQGQAAKRARARKRGG